MPDEDLTNSPAVAPEEKPEKTFSQADLDRIVTERVNRTKSQFSDYAELKAKAAKLDAVSEASKSDLERAVEAARKEGAQQAMSTANGRLVRAEARALAAASKFRDPSDAVAFLGDLSSVKVSLEGDVDSDSLKAALADLAKQKPYLLVEEKPTRPQGDAGQGPRQDAATFDMNQAIRAAAGRA